MKLVLFGATGMVGSRIATEASARGHQVLAVSRSGRSPVPGVTATAADATDREKVAEVARGADVVASACVPPRDGSDPRGPFLALNEALVAGVRAAGVGRLMVVGGAGGLEVAPGQALSDQPGFPEAYLPEAHAHRDVLAYYRTLDDPDWTYVSPAAEIAPGTRTGRFRVDGDQFMTDDQGRSLISAEDYAVAFVDELERHEHPRARMSVAY
ncbi:NAD(P)-dependent oxidoreductase [Streptomyces sp. NBC_00986]|uniref:NAD(P)-dependent oxidoreductase n=1 Tax=Streptomyces sp. NBC_00986 TaxID=2903702 RepID=UPI00386EF4FC|nr:NAD(P)H-binding protein [Streptomyces sp. NBC_00986]